MSELDWQYNSWFTIVLVGVAFSQNVTVLLYATGPSRLPTLGLKGAANGRAVAVGLRAVFLVSALLLIKQRFTVLKNWITLAGWRALNRQFRNALPIAGTFISATLSMRCRSFELPT